MSRDPVGASAGGQPAGEGAAPISGGAALSKPSGTEDETPTEAEGTIFEEKP